jgi:5-methylcytosine-specific restriction endonuclease McrA
MEQEQSPNLRRIALPKAVQLRIFRRDHWLCQWCAKPVIFAPVMRCIELEVRKAGCTVPLAYYYLHWNRTTAPLLDELGAVLDHKEPCSAGGPNTEENMVTSCAKCNGRKSSRSQEDWEKRKKRNAIKAKCGEPELWDGLSSLFVVLAERNLAALTAGERAWLKVLKQVT